MFDIEDVWEGWTKPIDTLRRKLSKLGAGSAVGAERRSMCRNDQKIGHFESTLDYVCKQYPQLATGKPKVIMDASTVDQLVQEACTTSDGQVVKDKQRYLVKVLTRGVKELGWQLPVPSPVQSVQMFPSMTTPDMAARLDDYDRINDAFLAGLENGHFEDTTSIDKQRDAGELLFSLVFHSGVISRRWFNRLSEAIQSGAGCHSHYTWLELEQPSVAENIRSSAQTRRRVILAPITELLLRRWYRRWGKTWPIQNEPRGGKSADEVLLKQFVEVLNAQKGITLNRRLDVFATADANLVTIAPGFLVHYARTPDLGASLSLSNWVRLVTGGQVHPARTEPQSYRENAIVGSPALLPPTYPLSDQKPIFKRLLKLVKFLQSEALSGRESSEPIEKNSRRRKAEANKLEAFKKLGRIAKGEGCSILLQLMCHYCRALLQTDESVSAALQQKVRNLRYLERLVPFATDIPDPEILDADEWQSIYETVISDFPGNGGELKKTLFEWHEFLHEYYGVSRVPMDEGVSYGVDAALLTPLEYHRAKNFLMAHPGDELASIQLALLIMGFRCGLRRTECWARQYGDFHGLGDATVTNPELLVRPTKIAGVKSDAAIRRLPLRLLLTNDELDWLTDFVNRRKLLRANDEMRDALFADPVSGTFRIKEQWAFDGLTAVLRSVSGDEDIRFHHLRHSFASLTLLRLLERKPFDLVPECWVRMNGIELMPVINGLDNPRNVSLSNAWRPLSQLSQWMGHSSERVTLKSYSHLLDFALRQYLLRDDRSYTIAQQQALLDKTPTALERFRHRTQLKDRATPAAKLAAAVRMPAKSLMDLPKAREPVRQLPVSVHKIADEVNPLLPYQLSCLVYIRMQAGFPEPLPVAMEKAAAQLDVELSIAQQWYERAKLLMMSSTAEPGEPSPTRKLGNRLRFSLKSKSELANTSLPKTFTRIYRAPELPTYIVPPQSKAAFKECMQLFKWLSDWMAEDMVAAKTALTAAAESVQRSKPDLRPLGKERQIAFMALMRKLRLASRASVTLTVKEENRKRALKFWAHNLSVAQNAIIVRRVDDQRIPKDGNVSFDWKVTHKLGKHFWHAIRFVVFTGCVLYDAVPESFRDGSNSAAESDEESCVKAVRG